MHLHYIDLAIVIGSLVLTLVIGLWAGRGVNNVKEYTIGNRKFSTLALVMTLVATSISGDGFIGCINYIYAEGLISILPYLTGLIQVGIIAFLLVPHMRHFSKCLTIGDIMRQLYGEYGEIITGSLSFLNAICMLAVEFFTLRLVFESMLGVTEIWPVILSVFMFSMYTAYGGIRSVTITDILQFLIISIGIPILAWIAVSKAGGLTAVFTQTPQIKLELLLPGSFPNLIELITYSFLPLCITSPVIIQRILMSRDTYQMKKSIIALGILLAIGNLFFILIAFSIKILYTGVMPDQIVAYSLNNLLSVGFKGIALSSVFAMILSTMDSFLNIAGISFVHNVIKPICDSKKISLNELKLIKLVTIFTVPLVVIFSLYAKDTIWFVMKAVAFTSPITLAPLVFGIIGLKVDKKSYYTASVVTLIVFFCNQLFLPVRYTHFDTLINVFANAITFFTMHYIQNKGFVMVQRDKSKYEQEPIKFEFFNPLHLGAYSRTKVEQFGAPYEAFGIFL